MDTATEKVAGNSSLVLLLLLNSTTTKRSLGMDSTKRVIGDSTIDSEGYLARRGGSCVDRKRQREFLNYVS